MFNNSPFPDGELLKFLNYNDQSFAIVGGSMTIYQIVIMQAPPMAPALPSQV